MERLATLHANIRVAERDGEPAGFCITRNDEVYQLYISLAARGQGVATALLVDAEDTIATGGWSVAWIACAVGNLRAARLYQSNGWEEAGIMNSELPTPDGIFTLDVWRFEKHLGKLARPRVGVGHVVMETNRMAESCAFMKMIGMRVIHEGAGISVYEMRGATHLILMKVDEVACTSAKFDLMVDDVFKTHERFVELGLEPTPIEARPEISHHVFKVREPSGQQITFFSNHASGKPV